MSNNHGVRDVTTTTSVIQQQALTSANGTDGQLMGKSVVQSQQQQSQPQTQTVNDIDGTFIQEFLGIQNQVEIMESSQQQIQQAIVEGVQQQQQQQPQIHIQDVSSPELYEIQGGSYNSQENGSNHKVIVVSELFKCEICNLAFIFKDHYFQHCDDHIRMVAEHINLSGIVPIHNFDEVLDFRNDTGSSSEQQQQQQQQQPHQLHEQQHIIVQNHPQNSHHHTVVVNNQHNNVNNNNNNNNDNDTVIEQQQVIGYQQHGQDTIVIGSSSNSNSNSSNCNDRQQQQHHIVTDGAILVKEEMEDDGGDGDQQQQHHMIINDGGAVGGAVTMATITTPTLTSLSSSSGSGSSAVVRRIKKTSQQQNQAALNTDWCKCLSCDFKFKTPISLSRHLNAHMENRNKCVVCNKYFTSCVSLKTHQRIHEAEDVGGGGTDLLQNNINNNNNSNNINSSCNSASGNNGRASVPSSPVSSPGGIGTPLAGNAGGLKVYNCKKCNIQFGTASQYRDHKLTHSNDVYTCNECSKAFLSIINLNRHRQSEHQHRKTFLCVTCNCEFTNEEFLQDHNKTRSHVHKQNTNNVNGNHTGNNNNGGGGGEGLLLDYFEDEEENNDGEDIVLVQQGQVQEVTRTAAGDVVVID